MRIFFAARCAISNENSLPEAYKRALRVALEMASRGHEIWMFGQGRHDYQDEFTCEAEGCIRFLDFPPRLYLSPHAELLRRCFRMALAKLQPDLMILSEAPLDGAPLEFMICAVKLGIRMVVMDHVCALWRARAFVAVHGSMFEGIVLSGPSSLHPRRPPKYYCGVPPYLEGSAQDAETILTQTEIRPKHWISVLSYEKDVQQLATDLLSSLVALDCAAVFLTPAPKECGKLLRAVAPQLAQQVIVLPPSDNLRFGLLQRSSLVIGSCEFTLLSEALALGTPFLGLMYGGGFKVRYLPRRIRRFVHATDRAHSDSKTLDAAVRLMLTPRSEMLGIHDGRFGAAAMVADFLESLPAARRKVYTTWRLQRYLRKCELSGFLEEVFVPSKPRPGISAATSTVQKAAGTSVQNES